MKRSECTAKKLREIGFGELPTSTADEYVTPLKDVAYLLREENFDCKVEVDTYKEYEYKTWETFDKLKTVRYNFEYLYIREHGTNEKWQKVARRINAIN